MKLIFNFCGVVIAKAVEGVLLFLRNSGLNSAYSSWVAAHAKISTRAMPSLPIVPRNMPRVLKRIA